MSAKDRASAQQRRDDARFALDIENGLRQLLTTPQGQAVAWWLYEHLGLGEQPSYTINAAEHTGYREGRRSVALAFADQAKRANWDGWRQMRETFDKPKLRGEEPNGQDEESEE